MKTTTKNHILSLLILLALCVSISSCIDLNSISGKGPVTKENKNLDQFSKIDISGAFEVTYVKSDSFKICIETNENLQKIISVKLENELLKIGTTKSIRNFDKLALTICCPTLKSINLSGANDLKCTDSLICEKLIIDMSGASDINLLGKSMVLEIELSGTGTVNAKHFPSNDIKVDLSGAANAIVFPVNSLNAEISGAGSIKYLGNPKSIKQDVSGTGSIEKIGE
ncbi:MAG: head GIN domain-containing protein [Bacteroidota bacterium]